MKKDIEKFDGFEIEWKSVSRIGDTGSQGHGLNFFFDGENRVIAFIVGWEWSRRETNHVKVIVLSPKSKEWGDLSADRKKILGDIKECVRIVIKNPEGKVQGEIKNNIHVLGNC